MPRRIVEHKYAPLPEQGDELSFRFDGRIIRAREGDTISSALLASGIRIFSRSFKYHRPRGVYDGAGYGPETLVTVDGEPNLPADRVFARQDMLVKSQNRWPSLRFDMGAVNDLLVPLLPNGFYYKMFHKPRWLWPIAEKPIRKMAGLGRIDRSGRHVDRRYEKRYRFPDVCVVGAGPAGLAAARAALEKGRKVLLIDDQLELGGHSLHSLKMVRECVESRLNGMPEHEAVNQLAADVLVHEKLEVLHCTTVFGVYEDNLVAAQQGSDHFKIRADSVVLAPGASDRHLVFENNDLPGIVTARGVERLIMLHAVTPGEEAVIVTCHDGGYHTAFMLHGTGTKVAAIVDSRPSGTDGEFERKIRELDVPVYRELTVHAAHGGKYVNSVDVGPFSGGESTRSFDCDMLVIAAGVMPRLSLHSMGRSSPQWDVRREILRVQSLPQGLYSAGEVEGAAGFARLYEEGFQAGSAAAVNETHAESVRYDEDIISALPADIESGGNHHFICKCMDITRKEAQESISEGFDQVESLKRYTSMGMGPCQGKSCHESVARLAALDTGLPESAVVPTNMRPPAFPVSFGILSGRSHLLSPTKRTPMHHCHLDLGVQFLDAGAWKRPHSYVDPGQETLSVRTGLGMIDVSTLGKLELSGEDVLEFLHFMMPGKFAKLAVGRTRYVIMVGEDGILFEDGTISHLDPGRFYLSTTTGNQDAIYSLFQWWLTTGNYKVQVKNLSAVYAGVNITGPKSREFLQTLIGLDLSNEAFPYMHCRTGEMAGVPLLLFRIGFTGELGYELHFPSEYGESLWKHLLKEGKDFGLKPFGVETQRVLRLEKGHLIPGTDTDALSNPYEAGVGFAIREEKQDFLGKAFLKQFRERGLENRLAPFRLQESGMLPEDGVAVIVQGKPVGRVTSSRMSPTLGYGIGMAWLPESRAAAGSEFTIRCLNGAMVNATVIDHAAYDPHGERLRG